MLPNQTVRLNAPTRAAIAAIATAAWPREMIGLVGGEGADVRAFLPLPNTSPDGDRFAVDPGAFAAATAGLEASGQCFLGFVHSHPNGPPRLSAVDRRELWHDCLQFVVAVDRDGQTDIACFRLQEHAVHELAITGLPTRS